MPAIVVKNEVIGELCQSVQDDSKATWFNILCDQFKDDTHYGKQFAHLILHSKHKSIRYSQVTGFLKKNFPNSFILVKQEEVPEGSEKTTAITDTDTVTSKERAIPKGLHFHCIISYEAEDGINASRSFRTKVQHALKNKFQQRNFHTKDPTYKFCAYNIVSNAKYYNEWDVFHNSLIEQQVSRTSGDYKCISKPLNNNTKLCLLNWMAYLTKERTAKGQRAFRVVQ
jgi:hypothetical protein